MDVSARHTLLRCAVWHGMQRNGGEIVLEMVREFRVDCLILVATVRWRKESDSRDLLKCLGQGCLLNLGFRQGLLGVAHVLERVWGEDPCSAKWTCLPATLSFAARYGTARIGMEERSSWRW